jgi:uncharacterized membrane protein YcaP (DUF421 family)
LHRLFSTLAFHSPRFETLIKGHANILVKDGKAMTEAMQTHKISQTDLLEELRLNCQIDAVENAALATLERSGDISGIRAKPRQ